MKKLIALLAIVLVLTGCGSANNGTTTPDEGTNNETPTVYKAGVGSFTTVSSKDVVDGAGSAEVVTTYAAVVVDENGIIKYVSFDTAQNTAKIDGEGKIALETAQTKKEKGDAYGMGAYAANGEWYKQIAHLESTLIGMNISDAVTMELDEAGKATNTDVLSGCTVHVNEFILALDAANRSLTDVEGAVKVAAGSYTETTAKDVVDGAGSAEVVTTFGMAVLDAEDKIVFAEFDTAQNKASVDGEGKVALEAAPTKKEKGEAYGMGKFAANGEWDKQIAHLESTLVGKTIADFTGAQLDDSGKSTDADVLSGCTVHVSEFVGVLNSAVVSDIK